MPRSAIEELHLLEERRASLLEDAKAELLQRIRSHLKELRALGANYEIVHSRREKKRAINGHDSPPCKICGFSTERPHDRRAHRWQERKAPFTEAELADRGLRRIGTEMSNGTKMANPAKARRPQPAAK